MIGMMEIEILLSSVLADCIGIPAAAKSPNVSAG